MKKYVYIVTDSNRTSMHVGMSDDLTKTLAFYKSMPSLFFDQGQQLSRLVYFEEQKSEELALRRFKAISHFTRLQKEKLVRNYNPDWLDLSKNFGVVSAIQSTAQQPNQARLFASL